MIKFRRNCGQTAAMVAGIEEAAGEVIVTMDADLQNDPRRHSAAARQDRRGLRSRGRLARRPQGQLLSRTLPSMIANRLIARVTGVDIKDNGCSLKAYRAEVIKRVPL